MITLEEGIENIKSLIEKAIVEDGERGKRSLINSSTTINILHEVVKSDLIRHSVNPKLINPSLGSSSPEVKLAGFLKFKTQDVCVFPNHLIKDEEILDLDGLHKDKIDPYGELFTEHILTINLRSQLSSLGKNIDTMYERTYAEPLNLHRRLPKMVLGEVYLLSAKELDSNAVQQKLVAYKSITPGVAKSIQDYIFGFSALNSRIAQGDDFFKYERIALLIVDFSQSPAKIYKSTDDLKQDGLLPKQSKASLEKMTFDNFTSTLLHVYEKRFGSGKLI